MLNVFKQFCEFVLRILDDAYFYFKINWRQVLIWWHIFAGGFSIIAKMGEAGGYFEALVAKLKKQKANLVISVVFIILSPGHAVALVLFGIILLGYSILGFPFLILVTIGCFAFYILTWLWRIITLPQVLIILIGLIGNFVIIYTAISILFGAGTSSIIFSVFLAIIENAGCFIWLPYYKEQKMLKAKFDSITPEEKSHFSILKIGVLIGGIFIAGCMLADFVINIWRFKYLQEATAIIKESTTLDILSRLIFSFFMGIITLAIPVVSAMFAYRYEKKLEKIPVPQIPKNWWDDFCSSLKTYWIKLIDSFKDFFEKLVTSVSCVLFWPYFVISWFVDLIKLMKKSRA